jgi:hypothetical protein
VISGSGCVKNFKYISFYSPLSSQSKNIYWLRHSLIGLVQLVIVQMFVKSQFYPVGCWLESVEVKLIHLRGSSNYSSAKNEFKKHPTMFLVVFINW